MNRTIAGIMLTLLFVSMFAAAFSIRSAKAEPGTIYIRADGSIDPPDAPISTVDNVTYILTGNITSDADGIVVERDNIIIDGAGFTVCGTGNGAGLNLTSRSNITAMNVEIKGFNWGIWLAASSMNTLAGNNVEGNHHGITLDYFSNNNTILGNNLTTCDYWGVSVAGSGNVVIDNSVSDCVGEYGYGINLYVTSNNTATDNRVFNNTLGIRLYHSENNIIRNNEISNNQYGIGLEGSSGNTIYGNSITNNWYGIWVEGSSNNNVSGNTVTANKHAGIRFYSSSYNSISGNHIANNWDGIVLWSSSYSSIVGNNIAANINHGILLYISSNNNAIFGNDIIANRDGIFLGYSPNFNSIYHNNFIDNAYQVYDFSWEGFGEPSINVWDDGYPSGGNYWSDLNPADVFSGSYQNETGSDKIGDTSYIIDANNTDSYLLIYPYGYVPSPDFNNDGIIDIFDIVRMALAFGSVSGMPNWDPYFDLNQDSIIDVFDLVVVALHFGETG